MSFFKCSILILFSFSFPKIITHNFPQDPTTAAAAAAAGRASKGGGVVGEGKADYLSL